MKNKYVYARLYDFCVKNDYKNPGRGVIKRKERVAVGIFAYIMLIVYLLLFLFNIYRSIPFLVIVILTSLGFAYETRMGLISLLNIIKIRSLRLKVDLNIPESFCVYHNRDGNYIKIQENQMLKINYHPFDWTVIKIVFKDKYKNIYIFRVNLKNIQVKIYTSRGFKEKLSGKSCKYFIPAYQCGLGNLDGITNIPGFVNFLRDKYREIREKISIHDSH